MIPQRHFLWCIIATMASVLITVVVYTTYYVYDSKTIPLDYEIVQTPLIGFNVDTDSLHFGTIPRGSSSTRIITLESDRDAMASIRPYGTDHVSLSRSDFLVRKDTPAEVNVTLFAPPDAKEGNYSGKLVVTLKRPRS